LNSQIIGTSTFWKFEFITGIILLAIMLPLNWQLTRYQGIVGPAIANLVGFTIYNAIRYLFLWKKFRMQPFTFKTAYTILLAATCYIIAFWLFDNYTGFIWMIVRSSVFCLLFASGMFGLKLSPDVQPVLATIKKRLRI
jgi:O-antigen/teichoic acid export membrane protein